MSAGWVAGSVRARGLAHRRLGVAAARRLAGAGSLADAVRVLGGTAYGRQVRTGQDLEQAQHAVAAALVWDLRVLAGWLPRGGVHLMRVLAAWFEIANTDELLAELAGRPAADPFPLGSLATAWPRLRAATSPAAVRAALASSAWGDPGGDAAGTIRAGMRARWAVRAAGLGGPARGWALGAAALLAAADRFVTGRDQVPAGRSPLAGLLGHAPDDAPTLAEYARRLPAGARWALAGAGSAGDLWRAEARWWARVEADGARLLRGSATGSGPVLGAVAVLAADARRVRAALEMAARGGGPLESYDAVA